MNIALSRRLRTALVLAPLAAILVAVGYWNVRPESFMRTTNDALPATESPIDFYAMGTRTVQYQSDGTRDYILTADKVEHLRDSDMSLLSEPELLLYRGRTQPWQVTSSRGEVSPEGTQVELIDDVRVERTDAKGRETLLTTTRMTVYPDREYAHTDRAVRIEAADGVTTATGMEAYLNDGRMLLLSNVRGQHEVR